VVAVVWRRESERRADIRLGVLLEAGEVARRRGRTRGLKTISRGWDRRSARRCNRLQRRSAPRVILFLTLWKRFLKIKRRLGARHGTLALVVVIDEYTQLTDDAWLWAAMAAGHVAKEPGVPRASRRWAGWG